MWYPKAMAQKQSVLVLGAGRVGSVIAHDLASDPSLSVSVADRDPARAELFSSEGSPTFLEADLSRSERLRELVAPFDLVVGAVPGWMGFETLGTVLECDKDAVDISFFEEDPFELDALAKERGRTAVVDCGVAPGLSNLVLGRIQHEFERIDSFVCLVGGLPEEPQPPWNYKAPYSPSDVIEMYTRPARIVRDGKVMAVPALTEPEELEFPNVGTLEAFNTDGLRTLLAIDSIPNLMERTLRYPGHRAQVELLASSGFLDPEREVDGVLLRPREISEQLLRQQWHQGKEDYDVTVMRLTAEGVRGGEKVRQTFDLEDHFDRERGFSSMARTTGYPCAAVARLVLNGTFRRPGIVPPEFIGADLETYRSILGYLEERGVAFQVSQEPL